MTYDHKSQYDPGSSAITRRAGCTWTSLANGIGAVTAGRKQPTPDAIKALVKPSEETDPKTAGWSLTDAALAASRYGMGLVVHSGDGWSALTAQLRTKHYVLLQGDSDQFGNATCSGAFDGDHCIGLDGSRSKVEAGETWWWIDDPICKTGRWERESVLKRYAVKLNASILFGAFLQQIPSAHWTWTCRPIKPRLVRRFRQYEVAGGRIVGGRWRWTRGMSVPCSAPQHYPGPDDGADLVQLHIPGGNVDGWYVNSRFAKENA